MSLPPHREKDAKAEGRGLPGTAKKTMAPFRSLMGRLLNVPMSEVKEQQRLYEGTRAQNRNILSAPQTVNKIKRLTRSLPQNPIDEKEQTTK